MQQHEVTLLPCHTIPLYSYYPLTKKDVVISGMSGTPWNVPVSARLPFKPMQKKKNHQHDLDGERIRYTLRSLIYYLTLII